MATRRVRAAALVLACASGVVAAQPLAVDPAAMRAQLTPQRMTMLSAELGAKISHVAVREGDRFRAGQTLVRFDCSLQNAQIEKARAHLESAKVTHAANRRLSELNAIGQVELSASEGEVKKAEADIAYLRAVLAKCGVVAPFEGRVSEQKAREEQFVQPGQPLLEIIDDRNLELEFIVPSNWVVWLKPGLTFKVQIEETATTYPAKLTRLAARVDPVSQTIKVVGQIDGRFPELMAGMSGRIQISPPR